MDSALTYVELDRQADRIARLLCSYQLPPESPVAVCLDRAPSLLSALVGVMRSGCAYVPIDLTCPSERMRYVVQDGRVTTLITDHRLSDRMPRLDGVKVLDIRQLGTIEEHSDQLFERRLDPDGLAYILYTSGSTGRPKGVLISHRGLASYLRWAAGAIEMNGRHGSLVHSSIGFDFTLTSLCLPLVTGQDVVLLASGADLLERLADALTGGYDFSFVRLTPSHLDALRYVFEARSRTGRRTEISARAFVVGGEALLARQLRSWQALAPHAVFFNHYGPTETVVGRVVERTRADLAYPATRTVPIGRPIDHATAYVLTPDLRLVPTEAVGELYLGGVGLARGYLGLPKLTAERFLPDPFGSPGGRLYRTGDRARWLADGRLEFVGRTDDQVKVRGHRVELAEVEAVLGDQPSVRAAAVVLRASPRGSRLVAYVVWDMEPRDDQELRRSLLRLLPDYMVPAEFVTLDRLPTSANGKLDRAALPAPELTSHQNAPDPATAHPVATVWARVLGVAALDESADFFALGGDSIQAIRMTAELRRQGYAVTSGLLAEHPRLGDFIRMVDQSVHRPDSSAGETSAEVLPAGGNVPLLPIQAWFLDLGLHRQEHYNQAVLVHLGAGIDLRRLERALAAVVGAHEAFGLRFAAGPAGRWTQFDGGQPTLPEIERIHEKRLETQGFRAALTALHAGLDLRNGPLVRAAVLDRASGERQLLITAHHLVVDAVSWHVVIDDLVAAYEYESPPASGRLSRWARRLADHAQAEALAGELQAWHHHQNGPAIPDDHDDGPDTQASERSERLALPADVTRHLVERIPRTQGIQAHEALTAAIARTTARWLGGDSAQLALEGHGREASWSNLDLSRTVGWLTALYPVHLHTQGSWHDIVDQLRTIPGGGLGYGALRYLVQVPDLDACPAPGIVVNYLGRRHATPVNRSAYFGAVQQVFGDPTGQLGTPRAGENRRPHRFAVLAGLEGDRLVVEWRYSPNRHRRSTIKGLLDETRSALTELAALTESPPASQPRPSDFPLAGLDDRGLEQVMRVLGRSS